MHGTMSLKFVLYTFVYGILLYHCCLEYYNILHFWFRTQKLFDIQPPEYYLKIYELNICIYIKVKVK